MFIVCKRGKPTVIVRQTASVDLAIGAWRVDEEHCDRCDGRKICMDQGAEGAFCSSGNDCGSAFFCKQWGDGSRRCMGNRAPAGAPCSSGIDCAGSCKDRGDGLMVCMGG